jgi:poly-gamma-glutamate synthesis protein (capsule biosynthesis protein)
MGSSVSLIAVGDISLGDHPVCVGIGVRSEIRRRHSQNQLYPFEHAAPRLRGADLVFGNLETVLSRAGLRDGALTSMEMRGEPDGVGRLRASGFNVLNVANNHILQHGREAFMDTIHALEASGIEVVGVRRSTSPSCIPITRTVGGLRVTFLGYAFERDRYWSGPPLYAFGPDCDIANEVREARRDADIVICSMHWGEEFVRWPSSQMVRLGRQIIEAGAHAVIGHHPHVFHGLERYRHGVIAYSLGNFAFDMLWDDILRNGIVLRLVLEPGGIREATVSFVHIGNDYQPLPLSGAQEVTLAQQFDQLSAALAVPRDDNDYRREHARLVSRNRRRSYGHFLRHALRYPPGLWFQIVSRSTKRKLERFHAARAPQ